MVRFGIVSAPDNRQKKRAEVRCPHTRRQPLGQPHTTMNLREAIDRGEERLAFRMVWNGANPNEVFDEDSRTWYSRRLYIREATLSTPLILAAAANYEVLTGVLLLKGARVDLLTDRAAGLRHRLEYSPLWHAVSVVEYRDADKPFSSHLIRMLIEAGESDDLVPFALKRLIYGYYHFEEQFDDLEEYHAAIRAIVELKPGVVNRSFSCDGEVFRPLHFVQDRETLEILVRAGARIDSRTVIHDRTPLICYARHHCVLHLDVIQGFLEHGADLNVIDDEGYTVLMHVVYLSDACDEEVVDALLRWGADETIVGKDGKTAADIARSRRMVDERIVQLLVNAPIDRRWRRRGLTVMCVARIGRTSVVVTNEDPLGEFLQDTNDCHQGIFRRIIGFL